MGFREESCGVFAKFLVVGSLPHRGRAGNSVVEIDHDIRDLGHRPLVILLFMSPRIRHGIEPKPLDNYIARGSLTAPYEL